MRSRHQALRRYGTLTAVALSAAVLGMSTAAAAVDPAPIGPHQWFSGQVNGVTANAVITVGCVGPVLPGQTGHPVSGQSVSVVPAPGAVTSNDGYTGEAADHVVVDFGAPASTGSATVLQYYGVKAAVPTSIELPCYGSGKVVFVPAPTSSTARTATVPVTYRSIGV